MNTTHPRQTTDQPRSSLLGRLKPAVIPQLRLTAMMDVVFLLLIFFVLTANFAIDEGVFPADLPGPGRYDPLYDGPPQNPLIIILQNVGVAGVNIWLDGAHIQPKDDFDHLFQMIHGWRYDPATNPNGLFRPDNLVEIRTYADVRWKHSISAYNAALRAGYTNIQFSRSDR